MSKLIGVVYKITDLDNGKFYIGSTKHVENFLQGSYNGTGRKWLEYYRKFKHTHSFKREILKDNFETLIEMHTYETECIRLYSKQIENERWIVDETTGCMNLKPYNQSEIPVCEECGGTIVHKKHCSQYSQPKKCVYCGKTYGYHLKWCKLYKKPEACQECGGDMNGHHYKTCSLFKQKECAECGGKNGHHKNTCSKHIDRNICDVCGGKRGHHFSQCDKYKQHKECSECGSTTAHKKTCSKYKRNKLCLECGSKGTIHKKSCSKYEEYGKCEECGSVYGKHKKYCKFNKKYLIKKEDK